MTYQNAEEIAFPKLSDEVMHQVGELGTLETFENGQPLIEIGQKEYPFCLVVSGEVSIVDTTTGQTREVVTHGPGGFIGDVDILTGRPAVISAIAKCKTQAYIINATKVRRLLNEIPDLSELLLEAFQMRRRMLEASEFLGTRVIGTAQSKETAKIREFFYKNHVPHTFFDVAEEEGHQQLCQLDATIEDVPVVACSGHVAKKPSIIKIAECLGISREVETEPYDFVIVGAGPAGLAAAVYAASEGIKTLVIDSIGPGGQAGGSSKIENFIGFPSGLSGAELANRGYLQALKFGAQFTSPVSVKTIRQDENGDHLLDLCTGQTARAKCVLAATGVTYRQLDLEGCRRLEGAGVYYAATSVEARVCRDSTAIIVGSGNSAGQAAMFLADHASHVKMLIRGDELGKGMSSYLCNRILKHKGIEVIPNTEISGINGDQYVESVLVRNNKTEAEDQLDCTGVFIFIGARPHTDWLPESVRRDEKGFVLTGSAIHNDEFWTQDRTPCDLETTCPGILAAGDVRSGTTKRCGFAVGDGSLAVTCVHRYLNQI
ncbi:FAD-dependent oxidoreductase [Gimesia aquarii]|uniref:Thioredoxin reductase n=1 Tax=Gimesia aquarii TaxID=2527964 RepID=A0A517W034_9PLAN|nr:FAD-dependent oxidoreductase [Gimesia aquarii]QDT98609.1 Thioredoxin reductase [Gimesia aquarii]